MNLHATKGLCFILATVLLSAQQSMGQNPSSCASVTNRANSNGGANSCPNVNLTPYATNFVGTSYALPPTGAKTGNLTLTYSGSNLLLTPYAITAVYITTTGTTLTGAQFGPAGVPTLSGGNTQVSYCFYGSNLPTAGTLSLQLTDPQTGINYGFCSYDASCNSNCAVVANPTALILPVKLTGFNAQTRTDGTVLLRWNTAEEQNNKGFAVERSAADSVFTQLAFVPSSHPDGNSSAPTTYSYTDHSAVAGGYAYRLRQEDKDGNPTYSPIVEIDIAANNSSPKIYAEGAQVNILFPASGQFRPHDIRVYDAQGRTLRRQHALTSGATIISGLPPHNIYYIAVTGNNGQDHTLKAVYLD